MGSVIEYAQKIEELLQVVHDESRFPRTLTVERYIDPAFEETLRLVLRLAVDQTNLNLNLTRARQLMGGGTGGRPTNEQMAEAFGVCAGDCASWGQQIADLREEALRRQLRRQKESEEAGKREALRRQKELEDTVKMMQTQIDSRASSGPTAAEEEEERAKKQRVVQEEAQEAAAILRRTTLSLEEKVARLRSAAREQSGSFVSVLDVLVANHCVQHGAQWENNEAFEGASAKEAEWKQALDALEKVLEEGRSTKTGSDSRKRHAATPTGAINDGGHQGKRSKSPSPPTTPGSEQDEALLPQGDQCDSTGGWKVFSASMEACLQGNTKAMEGIAALLEREQKKEGKGVGDALPTEKEMQHEGNDAFKKVDATRISFKKLQDEGEHPLKFAFCAYRSTQLMPPEGKDRGGVLVDDAENDESQNVVADVLVDQIEKEWEADLDGLREKYEGCAVMEAGSESTAAYMQLETTAFEKIQRRLMSLQRVYAMRKETERATRLSKMAGEVQLAFLHLKSKTIQ